MKKSIFVVAMLVVLIPTSSNLNTIDNFDVYFGEYAVDEFIKKLPAPGKKKLSTMEEKLFKEIRRQSERRRFWINTI